MAEMLLRARLGDTALVSLLLLVLSAVHFVLLAVGRSHRFHSEVLERAYRICLLASWGPLALGAAVLAVLWGTGRKADRKNFTPATPGRLLAASLSASAVALGCVLLAIAETFWIAEIGFARFHVVILLGVLSLVLLLWVAFQVVLVAREAARVRKHVIAHPPRADVENMEAAAVSGAALAEDKVFP